MVFFIPLSLFGQESRELTPHEAQGKTILSIKIVGLKKTQEKVVKQELLIKKGTPFNLLNWQESIRKLKNLRIFRTVAGEISKQPDEKINITLKIAEKWTLLPIFRVGGGGGSVFGVFGLYDINLMGNYLEAGSQYEYFQAEKETHSGVIWYRDRRFLNIPQTLGGDIWQVNRIRQFYTKEGTLEGAYHLKRTKINLFFTKNYNSLLEWGIGYTFLKDQFSLNNLSQQQLHINHQHRFVPPADGKLSAIRFLTNIGQLDYDNYLVRGQTLSISMEHSPTFLGSHPPFTKLLAEILLFQILPFDFNIGTRFKTGWTDSDHMEYQFAIGGLETLRGFHDRQFRGSFFWSSNNEIRLASIKNSWFVLQHNLFIDIASSGTHFSSLKDFIAFSSGTGIRLISPRIARLVIRLDYAWAFGDSLQKGFSFGMQQFF